ncbi:MAG: zinc dependent phospholipase C family protein [Clostridia bacterium]|nr:zinc dependent phospholipase C family protein [Clostridia bacterium]
MSSYVMHLCISNKIKENLNLTDKFLYGSVLPDIIKEITGDREGTHFLKESIVEGQLRKLPQIEKAIAELDIGDKEIKLGYIAHLIEDYIWFSEYIPKFTKKVSNEEIKYLKDGTIHSIEEYRNNIYFDYSNSNKYLIDNNIDFEKMKEGIVSLMPDENQIKVFSKSTDCTINLGIASNTFLTKEVMDEYLKIAQRLTEAKILELLGE